MNKRLIAIVMVFAMMFSTVATTFADTAIGADAQACETIGMLQGDGAGVNAEYLQTNPTRLQAAIMFLRLKGLEADALAFTGTDNFVDTADYKWDGGKAIMAYLKAHPELGWVGTGTGNFNPDAKIDAKSYYKVMLEALGYKQNSEAVVGDFGWDNVVEFAAAQGLAKVAGVANFTVNDLASATVEGLQAKVKGTAKSLVAALIEKGKINEAKAKDAGLYTPVVVAPATVAIKSAIALNSKVVEVKLNTAAATVDAAVIAIKDAAGTAVAVASAEIAGYDATGKTVLVTLAADTKVGTLYTVTSGTTAANFGGRAADTAKPTVTGVVATDYNKVTVTFSEAIKLNGAVFAAAEKYGTKAALNIVDMKYTANNVIVLTTDAQKASTLYGIVIDKVADLAGNVMDKNEASTFVGQAIPTTELQVGAAAATEYNKIVVKFNVNVDPSTVVATAFKVEEAYGTKATLAITDAKVAVEGDLNETGAEIAAADAGKYVVLTVGGTMKAATLYKATVTGIKTAYGKALVAANTTATFVGKEKPVAELVFGATPYEVVSNTQIKVNFAYNVDAATVAAANFAMNEVYNTKAPLEIKTAEVSGKTVTLTVAPMNTVLYKLTVNGVKDVYGNALKTANANNVFTFAGKAVAAKISTVVATRVDDTHIKLTFNENVGATATDIAHYVINNNVGYPEKVEVSGKDVTLTIPVTDPTVVYTVTVKGLENADGVMMDAAGVTAQFVGKGLTVTEDTPELVGAIAMDNQTLKIFFDRIVTDKAIDGPIWDSKTNKLQPSVFSYVNNLATVAMSAVDGTVAYKDADNANALIVRVKTDNAFNAASAKDVANKAFTLVGKTNLFDTDKNQLIFIANDTEPTAFAIEAVMAMNNNTLRVFFSEAVQVADATQFAKVFTTGNADYATGTASATIVNAVAVDTTNKVYDFKTSAAIEGSHYFLIVNPSVTPAIISNGPNVNGVVTVADENTASTATGIQHTREFAGSTAVAGDIKDIAVVMENEKTIKMYFPEVMNTQNNPANENFASSVLNKANYSILYGTGATAVAAENIVNLEYVAADRAVVMTLNKTIANTGDVYVEFNKAIANALETSFVKNGTAAIKAQFAISTAASAKVTVTDSVYFTNNVLTVTFNQAIQTPADLTVAAETLAALKITVVKAGGVEDTLKATDVTSITVEGKAIKITVKANTLEAGKVGKVEFASANAVTGINGNNADTTSSAIFAQ